MPTVRQQQQQLSILEAMEGAQQPHALPVAVAPMAAGPPGSGVGLISLQSPEAKAAVFTSLTEDASLGSSQLRVESQEGFSVGSTIKIADADNSEINTIAAVGSLILAFPLVNSYRAGATVMQMANLRLFIEKLNIRRRRIRCSSSCKKYLLSVLMEAAADAHLALEESSSKKARINVSIASAASKDARMAQKSSDREAEQQVARLPFNKLRSVLLGGQLKNLKATMLQELVYVARAYYSEGDGCVSIKEFLDEALEVPRVQDQLLPLCPLFALVIWLALAPVIYCTVGGWSVLDAFLFAVMAMLCIGQDLVVPDSDDLRILSVAYVLLGAAIVAWAWSSLTVRVLLKYETFIKDLLVARDHANLLTIDGQSHSSSTFALEDLVEGNPDRLALALPPSPVRLADTEQLSAPLKGATDARSPRSVGIAAGPASARSKQALMRLALTRVVVCLSGVLTMILIGAITVSAWCADCSFAEALYWSAFTCTTIGFNGWTDADLSVGNDSWKAFLLVFAVVAVPSCLMAVLSIADVVLKVHSNRVEQEMLSRSLPVDLLIDLDANGNGISKLEFVCATLMAADKVTKHDLWQVLEQFRKLDLDGSGTLTAEKLSILRHEFKGVAREVHVAAYAEKHPLKRSMARDFYDEEGAVPEPVHEDVPPTTGDSGANGGAILRQSSEGSSGNPPGEGGSISAIVEGPVHESAISSGKEQRSRISAVRFATSVGEVVGSSLAHGVSVGEAAFSASKDTVDEQSRSEPSRSEPSRSEPSRLQRDDGVDAELIRQFHQDMVDSRKQLGKKEEELVLTMRAQQQTEIALRQVYAERQSLHGEVARLQDKIVELQARLAEEKKAREEAERVHAQQMHGAAMQNVEAEAGRSKAERHLEEVHRKMEKLQQHCSDAEAEKRKAEGRAETAERTIVECNRRLEAAEHKWRLEADVKVQQVQKECAELDLQRQNEIRSALLALQALSQDQQMLRTQLQRSQSPPPMLSHYLAPALERPQVIRTGRQPWEVWERATAAGWRGLQPQGNGLLSGRVREQAELLESQVKSLAAREQRADAASPYSDLISSNRLRQEEPLELKNTYSSTAGLLLGSDASTAARSLPREPVTLSP